MVSDSASNGSSLFSPELHEIGIRVVDMLNQTGFLYRFPGFAGVTLACISQHIAPMKRLLRSCEQARRELGKEQSGGGYALGKVSGPDPLIASLDYTVQGLRTFLSALSRIAGKAKIADHAGSSCDIDALIKTFDESNAPHPETILELKEVIESFSEEAAREASKSFEPMADLEWQKFRMVIFYFLMDLQKRVIDNS